MFISWSLCIPLSFFSVIKVYASWTNVFGNLMELLWLKLMPGFLWPSNVPLKILFLQTWWAALKTSCLFLGHLQCCWLELITGEPWRQLSLCFHVCIRWEGGVQKQVMKWGLCWAPRPLRCMCSGMKAARSWWIWKRHQWCLFENTWFSWNWPGLLWPE